MIKSVIYNTEFLSCYFYFTDLSDSLLSNSNFSFSILKGVTLKNTFYDNTKFIHSMLMFPDMRYSMWLNTEFSSSVLYKPRLCGIKEYKNTAKYKNTLVIAPRFCERENNPSFNEEAREFFNNPQFKNFESWFKSVKNITLKSQNRELTKSYLFVLKEILKDESLKELHNDVWITIIKFIKFWEKYKIENLSLIEDTFSKKELEKFNKLYSTKEFSLTNKDFENIYYITLIKTYNTNKI